LMERGLNVAIELGKGLNRETFCRVLALCAAAMEGRSVSGFCR
jgi:hypothetical protein